MRTGAYSRKTRETDITAEICLDGGLVEVSTGIGFFDHMLEAFAVHGGFGLKIKVAGDLNVDGHHTAEDTGIALGRAMSEALGDKADIMRYGSITLPMDEALASAAVDICGRPFFVFTAQFPQERVGKFDTCLTPEFFRALAFNAGINLHLKVEYGSNSHHMIEALFKAVAHAIRLAATPRDGLLSTKGSL
ncbi:MAG TPA: imidazoleglycerol-phosphate dehydratase HisB [Candidatus Avimonas sp.]|jgi:imidazoleglycerol-phosphate dehydratase|nr:imidazoleglycerol-phosphate dehydratase HisB [Clostridiales bacterium]HOB35978.1 imidazoleglycerol-phosphate dehydratase HisB [Candidatus Avimonas sp.]HQA15671.1 imidazoleglycerol-phosphate dehydratase HisB [Candidatus Avimonas sp.]HQD37414.1 imidazoleglycerol-phosphate dehydratase HisB [Candidatus Avimonas sp.]